MSVNQFIHKDNINMLWEVISDEEIFKYLSRDLQAKVSQVFLKNISGFYESERVVNNSLVLLNKKYVLLILNHIKSNYPIQPSRIVIHNEPVKELITYEEIQNDRKSKFETDLTKKQEEFEDFMTVKPPPVPEFADKDMDTPIKEMDKILKEMQAQRNYEVEQINRNYNNSSQVDNWLKPQETSLKLDKLNIDNNNEQVNKSNNKSNTKSKYINQFENVTTIDKKSTKNNVSWNNNVEINTFDADDEEDGNIFLKLKKVTEVKPNVDTNLTYRIERVERSIVDLNEKMDKIIYLLQNKI